MSLVQYSDDPSEPLVSPRSLIACQRHGVDPSSLVVPPNEENSELRKFKLH